MRVIVVAIAIAIAMTFAIANIPLKTTQHNTIQPTPLLRLWGGVVGGLNGANKFGRASTHSDANKPEIQSDRHGDRIELNRSSVDIGWDVHLLVL